MDATLDNFSDPPPLVSFIIPTLNRERTIGPCLESIAKQTYPNVEILVVDGESIDNTVSIASRYTSKIIYDSGTLGHARQHGAEESKGEILGIFDSDVILPSPDWLCKAVEKFYQNNKVGIVWPINKAPENASITAQCYFNLWRSFLNERLKKGEDILPGGNSLILRRAFEEAGGFNAELSFGEDFDLTSRVISLGYEVTLFENPIIHDTMSSLKEFTRKQIWGASSLQMKVRKEPRLVNMCMTWTAGKDADSLSTIAKDAFFKHVIIGFRGMMQGLSLERDCSWLILPLLMSIRAIVYGVYLISGRLCARD